MNCGKRFRAKVRDEQSRPGPRQGKQEQEHSVEQARSRPQLDKSCLPSKRSAYTLKELPAFLKVLPLAEKVCQGFERMCQNFQKAWHIF